MSSERYVAGEWKSPISSALIAGKTVRLTAPRVLDADNVFWIEARPTEKGRQVLVHWRPDVGAADVTPGLESELNVRTRVHEYGGGEYLVFPDPQGTFVAVFSNFSDGRLYTQKLPAGSKDWSEPAALTAADSKLRFADMVADVTRGRLVAVVEDHSEGEGQVNNFIASVDLTTGAVTPLVFGSDFYTSPRLSPSGAKLAWVQWNHPNMPWDTTELCVADVGPGGGLGLARVVGGGGESCAQQPVFGGEGDELHFVWDKEGWWNIYKQGADAQVEPLCPMEADFGVPLWMFGTSSLSHLPGGYLLTAYSDPSAAGMKLGLLSPGGGRAGLKEVKSPYLYWGSPINISTVVANGELVVAVVGSSAQRAPEVAVLKVPADNPSALTDAAPEDWKVLKAAFDPKDYREYLATPEAIAYPSASGRTAHMLFYPPQNPKYSLKEGELPPLLVRAHGGPTANAAVALSLGIQYFTSRGVAFADIDYGGSTGYGREYRNLLRGRWGIVDVEDCCEAARYLAAQGRVDAKKMCIDGGSAGGFTTLACLAFKDVFSAGDSSYGVADLSLLAKETHKFESRYLDSLVGPYPEAKETYDARSPLMHVEGFSAPVVFFQGLDDKVVPPDQAEHMHAAIKSKGLPTALVMFEGEGHGFRGASAVRRALDGELYFFGEVLGFKPPLPEDFETFEIDNLQKKA